MKVTKVITKCWDCAFFRDAGIPYTKFSNEKCILLKKSVRRDSEPLPDCPLPEYDGPPLKNLGGVKNENAI